MLQRRSGFTILEVLVAATILVIAIGGVAGVLINLLGNVRLPSQQEAASILAAERLQYFRAQSAPYQAGGGTYYKLVPGQPDPRIEPTLNNHFSTPYMMVREYLFSLNERQFTPDAAGDPAKVAQDRTPVVNLNVRTGGVAVARWARNEIPGTPADWSGVYPNDDTIAAQVNSTGADNSTFGEINKGSYRIGAMPRANEDIRPLVAGAALPEAVTFVREVWLQTNNSYLAVASPLSFSLSWLNAGGWWNSGAFTSPAPVALPLPPNCIAVTVRVFARDPRIKSSVASVPLNRRFKASNPGYNPNAPLATVVGYFSPRQFDDFAQ